MMPDDTQVSMKKSVALSLFVLLVCTFLIHLMPLAFSSYPFNNDGLTECTSAENIVESGRIDLAVDDSSGNTHSSATPSLNLMLAFTSSAIGANPLSVSQILISLVSIITVGGIFLLGRLFSGNVAGGLVAGFSASMMGTFLFTTASVWKESLGICLLVLLVLCFSMRSQTRYRIMCFVLLLMTPLTHHLVAVVAVLVIVYPVTWRIFVALRKRVFTTSHLLDVAMVAASSFWLLVFYQLLSLDRLSMISSMLEVVSLILSFTGLAAVMVAVLSMRKHKQWTFAPAVGTGIAALIIVDYYGYLYPYEQSASELYFVLVVSFACLLALSWYGTEHMVRSGNSFRAIQLGLLMAPLAVIGFGVILGLTTNSHRVLYRTFDLADLFIFAGVGVAMMSLRRKSSRRYLIAGSVLIIVLVLSFPFAYWSGELLGVRHDTNSYEADAFSWISRHDLNPRVSSEERLSYIGQALYDIPKDASLPIHISDGEALIPSYFGVIEASWVSTGVNAYPYGTITVTEETYDELLYTASVYYVGGPVEDVLTVFRQYRL